MFTDIYPEFPTGVQFVSKTSQGANKPPLDTDRSSNVKSEFSCAVAVYFLSFSK